MTKAPTLTDLDHKKLLLQRQKQLLAHKLTACFVATDLNSKARGTVLEAQRDGAHRGQWIIAANSVGKTAYGAREIAWHFLGAHPYKPRLPEWGDQPLLLIVSSKTTQIIQQEIWINKLKPLIAGEYVIDKEDRECVRLISNPKNGNRIKFVVHNDAFHARERLQGFTAHVAWIDEMPDDSSYISEMLMRLRAGDVLRKEAPLAGYFYCTMTPLVESDGVKALVESASYPFKKYVFKLEDNPFYEGWSSDELDVYIRQRCQDDVEFQARRHGLWYYSSERVFGGYNPEKNRTAIPFPYLPSLQHALVVDPAASGKVGVSLAVLAPSQSAVAGAPGKPSTYEDVWWIVASKKLEGAAASLLVAQIEKEFVTDRGVYVTEDGRICDCAPSGFYKEALVQKIPYRPYRQKNDKKKESIEDVNKAFYNGLLMLADTPETEELHKELLSAKWKENETEIKNSHKYHCADTARYLYIMRPKRAKAPQVFRNEMHALKMAWNDEKAKKEAEEEAALKKKQRLRINSRIKPSQHFSRRSYGR